MVGGDGVAGEIENARGERIPLGIGDADALLGEGIVDDAVDVAMIETFDVDELFRECVVSLKARILVEALFVEPIMRLSRDQPRAVSNR